MHAAKPERLSLRDQQAELVTVTNGPAAEGRALLPAAIFSLLDGFGNTSYVQDVAATVSLLPKDGAHSTVYSELSTAVSRHKQKHEDSTSSQHAEHSFSQQPLVCTAVERARA